MFNNAGRLKVNMGNIYFKLGQYAKAIKFYRMALDQVIKQKDLVLEIVEIYMNTVNPELTTTLLRPHLELLLYE